MQRETMRGRTTCKHDRLNASLTGGDLGHHGYNNNQAVKAGEQFLFDSSIP